MSNLTDELLIEAYLVAIEHGLDDDFISLLSSEIKERDIMPYIKGSHYS